MDDSSPRDLHAQLETALCPRLYIHVRVCVCVTRRTSCATYLYRAAGVFCRRRSAPDIWFASTPIDLVFFEVTARIYLYIYLCRDDGGPGFFWQDEQGIALCSCYAGDTRRAFFSSFVGAGKHAAWYGVYIR